VLGEGMALVCIGTLIGLPGIYIAGRLMSGVLVGVSLFDPLTHLVYSASKSDVRHVFLAGEQVVRDGQLTRLSLDDTLAAVEDLVPSIKAAVA